MMLLQEAIKRHSAISLPAAASATKSETCASRVAERFLTALLRALAVWAA